MELGELTAPFASASEPEKCPFKKATLKAVAEEEEDRADDDLEDPEPNNSRALGRNLESASSGEPGTINDESPFPAEGAAPPKPQLPRETTRNNGGWLTVPGDPVQYPFGVSAHHLIPGKASLARSLLYKKYMVRGGTVVGPQGRVWEMQEHIGYNVNGCHNGAWLPANHGVRQSKECLLNGKNRPMGFTWSDRSDSPNATDLQWCWSYMEAAIDITGMQFHDSHESYSENVQKVLNKLVLGLYAHQIFCNICQNNSKVPPPYELKERLYGLSDYLRTQLSGRPRSANFSWFTSSRYRLWLVARQKQSAVGFLTLS